MAFLLGRTSLITLLDVCLKIFRVLGFLPYSWHASGRYSQTNNTRAHRKAWSSSSLRNVNLGGKDKKLPSAAFPCCFKRQQSLVAWSWLFVLVLTVHCLSIIAVHVSYISLDVYGLGSILTTSNIATIAVRFFSVLLPAALMAVLLWRGDQLGYLLQVLSNIVARHRVSVRAKTVPYLHFVFLLFAMTSVVVTAHQIHQEAVTEVDVVKKQLRYFEDTSYLIVQIFFNLTVTVLVLLFRAVAVILSENYTNILREKLSRETLPDLMKVGPADCGKLDLEAMDPDGGRKTGGDASARKEDYALQDLVPAAHDNGMMASSGADGRKVDYALQDLFSADLDSGMVTSGDSRKEKAQPPSPLTTTDITTAAYHLHDLHQFQHILNDYFGLPLALSLVKMMVQVIINVFFAASTTNMYGLGCFVVAVTLDVSLLVHLFSAPECVTLQVGTWC